MSSSIDQGIMAFKEKHQELFDASEKRKSDLQDWIFIDEFGNETWPQTDEDVAASWEANCIYWRDATNAPADLSPDRCPIEVVNWPTFIAASEWFENECVLHGMARPERPHSVFVENLKARLGALR